jgi:hypothetical protein
MTQTATRQRPAVVLRSQYRQLKSLLAVVLIALVSVSVTAAALVVEDSGTPASTASKFEPFTHSQASVETAKPDESKLAAAISKRVQLEREAASRPDEAKIAASVSQADDEAYGGFHTSTGRSDETKTISISPTIHHN